MNQSALDSRHAYWPANEKSLDGYGSSQHLFWHLASSPRFCLRAQWARRVFSEETGIMSAFIIPLGESSLLVECGAGGWGGQLVISTFADKMWFLYWDHGACCCNSSWLFKEWTGDGGVVVSLRTPGELSAPLAVLLSLITSWINHCAAILSCS